MNILEKSGTSAVLIFLTAIATQLLITYNELSEEVTLLLTPILICIMTIVVWICSKEDKKVWRILSILFLIVTVIWTIAILFLLALGRGYKN